MSLNTNLNKYSIRCSSEGKVVYSWDEKQPSTCPNNNGHLIDLSSIKIIDTVIRNSVNIIQSSGTTGDNYRVESKKLIIPANTEIIDEFTWEYPIDVMTINWYADITHIGDVINGYMAPNTTIGVITRDVIIGDNIIHVSPSTLLYIKIGYEINITNGLNNIIMGEATFIDNVNNTIICTIPSTENISSLSQNFIQMTVHNIYNINLIPGIINLANKRVTSSALPANTSARLKYKNNSNIEKRFIFWFEFMY